MIESVMRINLNRILRKSSASLRLRPSTGAMHWTHWRLPPFASLTKKNSSYACTAYGYHTNNANWREQHLLKNFEVDATNRGDAR